jgi:hypothetical protein
MKSRRIYQFTLVVIVTGLAEVQGFLQPTRRRIGSVGVPAPNVVRFGFAKQSSLFSTSIEKERQELQASATTNTLLTNKSSENGLNGTTGVTERRRSKFYTFYTLPRTAYRIYTSYFQKLWTATNTSARKKIANDKVRATVREVHDLLLNTDEYGSIRNGVLEDDATREAKEELLAACNKMLAALTHYYKEDTATVNGKDDIMHKDCTSMKAMPDATFQGETTVEAILNSSAATASSTQTSLEVKPTSDVVTPQKKHRSILFGAIMGAVVACWVFSGNYIFTGIFCLMTILGQLEYYRMIMNTGVFPARRISVIGATSMFLTVRPHAHSSIFCLSIRHAFNCSNLIPIVPAYCCDLGHFTTANFV